MATKKAKETDTLGLPPIVYVEVEDDGDDDIYLNAYESLVDAAAGNVGKPATIGTYRLVEVQKVRATFEVVK